MMHTVTHCRRHQLRFPACASKTAFSQLHCVRWPTSHHWISAQLQVTHEEHRRAASAIALHGDCISAGCSAGEWGTATQAQWTLKRAAGDAYHWHTHCITFLRSFRSPCCHFLFFFVSPCTDASHHGGRGHRMIRASHAQPCSVQLHQLEHAVREVAEMLTVTVFSALAAPASDIASLATCIFARCPMQSLQQRRQCQEFCSLACCCVRGSRSGGSSSSLQRESIDQPNGCTERSEGRE